MTAAEEHAAFFEKLGTDPVAWAEEFRTVFARRSAYAAESRLRSLRRPDTPAAAKDPANDVEWLRQWFAHALHAGGDKVAELTAENQRLTAELEQWNGQTAMEVELNIPPDQPPSNFPRDLARLLNRYSAENGSNTPDHILAEYLDISLNAWNTATHERDQWYLGPGKFHAPGQSGTGEPPVERFHDDMRTDSVGDDGKCGRWNDSRTERCWFLEGHSNPHSWAPQPEDMVE